MTKKNNQGHNPEEAPRKNEEHGLGCGCGCSHSDGEKHGGECQCADEQCQCGGDGDCGCGCGEDCHCADQVTAELEKVKDSYLRLLAEFDNFKKRTARERVEIFKMANQETVLAILPILDDFERGIVESEKSSDKSNLEGFKLIFNKLKEALGRQGLSAIEVNPGDEFDVDTQEAIAQVPSADGKMKGKVIEVTQRGYRLADRVIRYAKVVVGSSPE